MSCDFCKAVESSKRGVLKHEYLSQIGKPEKQKVLGQAHFMVTQYECQQCHTKWQYEDDKNDVHAGWTAL